MPTSITFGIASFTTGDFLDEVQITRDIELVKRRGTSGNFTRGKSFNPTNDISIKGGGSSGLAVGLATPTISGISGGVMYLTKDQGSEKNSDFNDFDASVSHLPGGSNAS